MLSANVITSKLTSLGANRKIKFYDHSEKLTILSMQEGGKWNLSVQGQKTVRVICATVASGVTDIRSHLVRTAHYLSRNGVPALFLENGVDYIDAVESGSRVLIAFDVFERFSESMLPHFLTFVEWTWTIALLLRNDILEHCQRAMTLYLFYENRDMNRILFHSFVAFGADDSWSDAVIVKYVPVSVSGELRFRTIVQGGLSWHIGQKTVPLLHSVIMIPPRVHPFLVVDTKSEMMTVVGIDHRQEVVSVGDSGFIVIIRPNAFLVRYLKGEVQSGATRKRFSRSWDLEFDKATISEFFSKKTESEGRLFKNEENDVWQIQDPEMRHEIDEGVKSAGSEDDSSLAIRLVPNNLHTFYNGEYLSFAAEVPVWARDLGDMSAFEYVQLNVPRVLILRDRKPTLVPADNVISEWENRRYRPISGQKTICVMVFAEQSLTESECRLFVKQLAHSYSCLGFGKIRLFSECDGINISSRADMRGNIQQFVRSHAMMEMCRVPVINFALTDGFIDESLPCHCFVENVNLIHVRSPSKCFLREMCFNIYTRIRSLESELLTAKVHDERAKTFVNTLFFSTRYAPPFLLAREQGDTLVLHVAIDSARLSSVWTDDTGSSLHVSSDGGIDWIIAVLKTARLVLEGVTVSLTLCIVGGGLTDSEFRFVMSLGSNVTVCTVTPRPELQIRDTQTEYDFVIFAHHETTKPASAPPYSCIVASRDHLAYSISMYREARPGDSRSSLLRLSQDFSSMSWMSAKPNHENRVSAYPPHAAVLLQHTKANTSDISRFGFLP